MTCTLFQKLSPERTVMAHHGEISPERQLSFKCNVTSNLSALALKNTIVEASLQLPPTLFSSLGSSGQAEEAVYKLHLLAFRNGKLFPPTGNSSILSDGSKRRSVVTPVMITKIGKNTLLQAHTHTHTHCTCNAFECSLLILHMLTESNFIKANQ
nr:adhesion G protein-coupled receptor A3-like [Danio rerio]|eukprot:XP_021333734.1 adhesion G protein-coupled receptor A3-like [Danio rerio]